MSETISLEARALAVIVRHKNLEPGSVSLDTELSSLGISSLDAITIVYELEEELDIEVPNEHLESLRTVRDMVVGLQKLVDNRDAPT
jgi:acyl carrier protein